MKMDPKKFKDMKNKQSDEDDEVTSNDLQKSLDRLAGIGTDGDSISRKQQLLSKAMDSSLDDSENEELRSLLGSDNIRKSEVVGSSGRILAPLHSEPLNKSIEVSSFLSENHEALTKSLSAVAEAIDTSDQRSHQFDMVMAKALRDIGLCVQENGELLKSLAVNPARGPKSQFRPNQRAGGFSGVLEKAMGGRPPEGESLSKSDVLNSLDSLLRKSVSDGHQGRLPTGEDISMEVAKIESSGSVGANALRYATEHYHEMKAAR